MTNEPKGITLTNLDELLCLNNGTPITILSGKKPTELTRKLAIVQALETHSETEKGEKFKAFDLGMRFESANGQSMAIDAEEAVMIKSAIEKAWPQPGVYVPLCRWLEGG